MRAPSTRGGETGYLCRMGAVDIVVNLYTEREAAENSLGIDANFLGQIRFPEELRRGVSVAQYLAKMDQAGVERSFLAAARAGDRRERDSREVPYERVHEVCRAHPGRFSGLAGIDPFRGMEGVRELERAVRDYGFVGAHLYPHHFELAPDHAKYYPYYAKCCELGIPIMMQVGQSLVYQQGRRRRSVGRPIALDAVACDFPELTLIGIHIGIPWTDEMIAMAWKHPNVYIGTDAYAPRYWPPQLVHYLDTYGREKVMFGTDWPVVDPVRALREIETLDIRPEAKALLLGDNARRVFKLGAAPASARAASA
jgi:predicted TIM-barrel fold metal-dependent hydrolase